jgi:hypothetical protein
MLDALVDGSWIAYFSLIDVEVQGDKAHWKGLHIK